MLLFQVTFSLRLREKYIHAHFAQYTGPEALANPTHDWPLNVQANKEVQSFLSGN